MKVNSRINCLVCLFVGVTISTTTFSQKASTDNLEYAIVIHGGAGNFNFESLGKQAQKEYTHALDSALNLGIAILDKGGSCIDAVENVIVYMENNSLFNAGKGAVFTNKGVNELDASIMSGNDLNAGAVAGVVNVKNPIRAARAVMEISEHVMLSGAGASEFSRINKLEIVEPTYFYTNKSYQRLQNALAKDKNGTVGCVALDKEGNLCAGTSTGGMTNKKFGRIGDSPIVGAGTYANNKTCGISATGHGEYFIRYAVAHDISALMEYKGLSIEAAAEEVIMKKLVQAGGSGGIVGLDNRGRPAMIFNSTGMFRAYGNSDGFRIVKMFKE